MDKKMRVVLIGESEAVLTETAEALRNKIGGLEVSIISSNSIAGSSEKSAYVVLLHSGGTDSSAGSSFDVKINTDTCHPLHRARIIINNIGACYYSGKKVEKSPSDAIRYYEIAAEMGDEKSANNLGYIYETGELVPADMQKAVSYYTQAVGAEQPDNYAQFALGRILYLGLSGERDESAGLALLKKSAGAYGGGGLGEDARDFLKEIGMTE